MHFVNYECELLIFYLQIVSFPQVVLKLIQIFRWVLHLRLIVFVDRFFWCIFFIFSQIIQVGM